MGRHVPSASAVFAQKTQDAPSADVAVWLTCRLFSSRTSVREISDVNLMLSRMPRTSPAGDRQSTHVATTNMQIAMHGCQHLSC